MMSLKRSVLTVGAAFGVSSGLGLLAAGAASAHARPLTPSVITAAGPLVSGSADDNPYQAGYEGGMSASGTLSGTVTVPKLTCKTADTNDVVIDWFIQGTVTSSGAFGESGGQIFLSCQYGDTLYNVTDNTGDPDSISVSPGDVIEFSDSASATGETLTYTDETSGLTATDTGAGIATEDALVLTQGLYDSSTPKVLYPKFSPVKYTGVTIDGTALGSDSPGEFVQVSSTGKKQITTSAITHGANFTNTYVSG